MRQPLPPFKEVAYQIQIHQHYINFGVLIKKTAGLNNQICNKI